MLIAFFIPILAFSAPVTTDYWMYIGAFTSRGAKGIYVSRFHTATGTLETPVLAAGRLWQASSSASGSLQRIAAQVRVDWPNLKMIVNGVQNPTFLVVHPNGRYLYSADTNAVGTVSAFQIDPVNAGLTSLNVKSSQGGLPSFVTIDRTGKNLLVADYSGAVAVLPIGADGHLKDATSVVHHKGVGSDRAREPHAHSVNLSPDNRFALAADTGLDEVFVYKFDSTKGLLAANDPPYIRFAPATGPRHLSFHPQLSVAYVIGEAGSSVTTLHWDSQRGILSQIQTVSTLPPDFHGSSGGSEVLVHQSGKFLYASNRGHESIAVFAIEPSMGTLTPVQYASTLGRQPRNFRIDPTGKYLFAENVVTDNVVEFRIDQQTGRLTPTGVTIKVPGPACIKFVAAK